MKRQKKTFWTLNRHHAEGFTLVELIVVIAIMAILGGVGLPVYSGYIEKTNKGMDQKLVNEIKYALTVAMYDDNTGDFSDAVVVKLSTDHAEVVSKSGVAEEQAAVEAAMAAAFGQNWEEDCKLRYEGWTVNNDSVIAYLDSTFNGKEEELLDTMSTLGGHLSNFFASGRNVPKQLQDIMDKYGASDSTGASNAAVLALAQGISEAGDAVHADLQNAMNIRNCYVDDPEHGYIFDINVMSDGIREAYTKYYGTDDGEGNYTLDEDAQDMVTLATTATLYAYAEGFAQYCAANGDNGSSDILADVEYTKADGTPLSSAQIAMNISNAFGDIVAYANGSTLANQYFFSNGTTDAQSVKDVNAFFAMMDAVDQSADTLGSNLGSSSCFDNAESLVSGYLTAGSILADGEAGVIVNPDKSVVTYLGGTVG